MQYARLPNGRKIGCGAMATMDGRISLMKSVPLFLCVQILNFHCIVQCACFHQHSVIARCFSLTVVICQANAIIIFHCSILIKTKIYWLVKWYAICVVCVDRSSMKHHPSPPTTTMCTLDKFEFPVPASCSSVQLQMLWLENESK